jgi:hypothetical protein
VPAKFLEPGEITVGGAQRQAVLDGKGCEMGVGDQVGISLAARQQHAQHFPVCGTGRGNPNRRTIKPFFDLRPGIAQRYGPIEDSAIRYEPKETHYA